MLALWKKTSDKPRQRIKKQRHHFATKVHIVKVVVFPVVMYGCQSWTIKKAEPEELMLLFYFIFYAAKSFIVSIWSKA